jgi:hypothetical protein
MVRFLEEEVYSQEPVPTSYDGQEEKDQEQLYAANMAAAAVDFAGFETQLKAFFRTPTILWTSKKFE